MVNYKVTLRLMNGEPEVQRFVVDDDKKDDFAFLKEKLCEIYPRLNDRIYQICWTDDEGDEVVIANDDALKIALAEMPSKESGLFKLTVIIRGRTKLAKEKLAAEREGRAENVGRQAVITSYLAFQPLHDIYTFLSSLTVSAQAGRT